ncbi:hypothetical protein NFI96_020704 [Prochilodus magdalenae]|nr:hypothetical protein NFI96_020704 [Prochilodus magdalenae]
MGAVYLFSEALSAAQILAIYQLGPGIQSPNATGCEGCSDSLRSECNSLNRRSAGAVPSFTPNGTSLSTAAKNWDTSDATHLLVVYNGAAEELCGNARSRFLACKGFLVIGYSLEKSSKVHVTRPVLDIFLAFARYLSNLPNGVLLLKTAVLITYCFNPAHLDPCTSKGVRTL